MCTLLLIFLVFYDFCFVLSLYFTYHYFIFFQVFFFPYCVNTNSLYYLVMIILLFVILDGNSCSYDFFFLWEVHVSCRYPQSVLLNL